jgi:NitT/TauT family transport system permease protein
VSTGSTASLVEAKAASRSQPAGLPGLLRKTARLLLGLAVTALIWEGAVQLFGIRPAYLPRLSTILVAVAATPRAYVDGFLRTLAETLIGFASGGAFGVLTGIAFFRVRALREMIFPIFVVSQTIPVIAFGALVVLWFGNTLLAKAVIAFYLTFFPVTVNTLLGLETVDPKQAALMRSFGASKRQLLLRLQLPTALPQIFVALRLASSLSLVGAIVGEWFGDTTGLGVLLLQAMFTENVVAIWGALLAAALLGTGFYAVIAAAERRLVFWSAEQ